MLRTHSSHMQSEHNPNVTMTSEDYCGHEQISRIIAGKHLIFDNLKYHKH